MYTLKNNHIVFDPSASNELLDAVLVSLFTRKVANTEELKNHHYDKGGYWGDLLDDTQLGSKLWLCNRETLSNELKETVDEYGLESLKWMLNQGIAKEIEVTSSIKNEKLLLSIFIDNNEFSVEV